MKIISFIGFLFSTLFIYQNALANDQCVSDILNTNLLIGSKENSNEKLTKIPESNLFFDHSLNMKGFITPSQSAFKKFITALNSKIAIVSENQVFYKYTYGIKGIQPNSVGKITSSEKFYQCPMAADLCPMKRAKLSKILKVVEKKEGSLLIIVTDLFIGSDELIGEGINKIRKPLKAALERGDSIGVYGIKSEFEGSISGICSGNSYNVATSRPFYVFTIGPKEHVLALKKIMDKDVISKIGEENVNFNIYTNDIIISPFASNNWPNTTLNPGEGISTINIFGANAEAYQFSVDKKSDPLTINLNLKDIQTPYTLPVKNLYTEVITHQQRNDSGACEKDWRTYGKKENVVYFDSQDEYKVAFNIFDKTKKNRLSLKKDKNYIFQINFKARSIGYGSENIFTGNGNKTTFDLTFQTKSLNDVTVYVNDELIDPKDPENGYSLDNTKLTFSTPPKNGDTIEVIKNRNDFWMNNWSFVCDDINNYIESGTTFFPTLNLSSFGSNLEDVQIDNFEDQVISQMNLGVYLER